MAEPVERYTLTVEEKVTKPEQAKSVTPSETAQTVLPDEGYALNRVNVGAIPPEYIVPAGKKTVTENGTGIDIASYAELDVAVPIPPTPTYQTKAVTPTKQAQQILPDTGYDALDEVDVAAIPSEYIVPSGTKSISANDTGIDVAAYASVDVAVPTPAPSLQDKTVTPTKQTQTVQADNGYDGLDEVTVNPIPNEYIVPTGTKSISQNGTGIDVTDYAEVDVSVQPNLQSKTATPTEQTQQIQPDQNYQGLSSVTVNPIPSQYIVPTGKTTLSQNATDVDIAQYAAVDVAVPMPDEYAIGGSLADGSLTGYHFKTGITRIRQRAFCLTHYVNLEIPNGVEVIDEYAFYQCPDLESVKLANTVKSVLRSGFAECPKLTNFEWSNGVTTLGNYTFWHSYYVNIPPIPSSITVIPFGFMTGNAAISSLEFLGDIATIGAGNSLDSSTCLVFKFLHNTAVPTLENSNAFKSSVNFKIVVPDALVTQWQGTTNWTVHAAKIIGETDYDNS